MKTKIFTDTATVVIFDPARLHHRRSDDGDWWSIEREELIEVNDGNALFLGVGSDGVYEIEVAGDFSPTACRTVSACLKVESGKLFIGAGEWTTGADLEPEATHGNVIIDVPPGAYQVYAWMRTHSCVCLRLDPVAVFLRNDFHKSQKLA